MTNQSLFGSGSRLVYDVRVNSEDRQLLYQGMSALLTGAGFSGTFTTYGVTVAVNGAATPAGTTVVYSGTNRSNSGKPFRHVGTLHLEEAFAEAKASPSTDQTDPLPEAVFRHAARDPTVDCLREIYIAVLSLNFICISSVTSRGPEECSHQDVIWRARFGLLPRPRLRRRTRGAASLQVWSQRPPMCRRPG